jgi:folylpolyglutamate synthase/dihydropteroate synthase
MSGFFFSSFEKYNIEDIDFRYLPVVCLDIGHNETAINRVAQQFKIDCQEKNIRVVCSLSKTRNLSIFQPLLLHFTHTFCESKVVKEIPENRLNVGHC